ncbi:MAG: tripartite tricarboxylate transporter substrate binding protein [Burkholderiaceae bacterium]
MRRQFLTQIAAAAATASAAFTLPRAFAQDGYPQKPLRLIVPFPPGGIVDIVGRDLAERLAARLGQPVVVENRSGAGGVIGSDVVAKSAPDGLNLVLATSGHAILPALGPLPFDPVGDFAPVATVADIPQVITVPASLGAGSLQAFTSQARGAPGKLSFASSGNGSLLHLIGEQYKRLAGIDITHVPYKGQPQALADLISGRVDMMPLSIGVALPHIQSGKLVGLAITADRRNPALPNVPTTAEAGLPDLKGSAWFAVLAPARTPAAIVQRLSGELERICAQPEFERKLQAAGGTVTFKGPAATADVIRTEIDGWRRLVSAAGIKAQ